VTAPEHTALAAELVERYREGVVSDDTALRALMDATGLDEGAAAFLLIDRWHARHSADAPHDDEDWWTR
jgi:hypothetical protein